MSQTSNIPNPSTQSVRQTVYKKIAQYALIKEIGVGSFARVYKGRCEGTGANGANQNEEFAIKMVSKVHLREENQALIDKEIEILLQLNHPNIIKLRDVKKTPNNWYLIFEYCELGDLEQYMKEKFGGRFPLDIAMMFIQQLCSAFQEIQRLKIVHRDLKLANILLNKDLIVKLGDFGFAKHFEQDSLLQSYCGTPITMAPEILKREKYNEKCDIWSLGVIMFQMIFGRAPFHPPKGAHIQDLINLIDRNSISFEGAYITPELQSLITSMLKPDPNQRLSFEEFFAHPCMQHEYLNSIKKTSTQQSSTSSTQQQQQSNNTGAAAGTTNAQQQQMSSEEAQQKNEVLGNQKNSATSATTEGVLEIKEKQNAALEYIHRSLHEQLQEELNAYLTKVQSFREVAQQLVSDSSTEFGETCAWSALLLSLFKTVKTIENHLDISLIISQGDENKTGTPAGGSYEETFRIPFPKQMVEKLKELSKELNTQLKSIKLENIEQSKNTDVYNMLFGNLLHYADYSLLNEFLNPPQMQLKYYSRCLKLCELLQSMKESVFSRMVIRIKDPNIEITKLDIQKIIQIPMKECEENSSAQSQSAQRNQLSAKKLALIKSIIEVAKTVAPLNHLEILNITDKSEELKTQQEIYQGRYQACLDSVSVK